MVWLVIPVRIKQESIGFPLTTCGNDILMVAYGLNAKIEALP